MLRYMCKGKIHRATVTEANLDYVGSITLDVELMLGANILPYEMVQITSLRNATRWKTYAIPAPSGSGTVCLNGPPAHLFSQGDKVIVLSLAMIDEKELETLVPSIVMVDGQNRITEIQRPKNYLQDFSCEDKYE